MFLIFLDMKLSSPKIKISVFIGEPLCVFHHCFHFFSLLTFAIFVFWVRSLFSLISFFHITNFLCYKCFFGPFLSGTSFCVVMVVVPRVLRIWESFFYSQALFTLHAFPKFGKTCFYQGFSGSWQFFLEGCRVSYWSSKHKPGPSVCLNHTVFSKKY